MTDKQRGRRRQPYLVQIGSNFGKRGFEQSIGKNYPGCTEISDYLSQCLDKLRQCNQPIEVLALSELLILHGLRISDVLALRPTSVLPDLSVRVVQSKGSRELFCHSVYYRSFWQWFGSLGAFDGFVFDRNYFYRLFKKIGIYGLFEGNVNLSVTHYPRHIRALNVSNGGIDYSSITNVLGHRSQSTASYYAKQKK